jgi:hypothetical protein
LPLDRANTHNPDLGVLLTGSVGRGLVGGAFSAGATLPSSVELSETSVGAFRLPFELTLVLRPTTGHWRFTGEGGLAVNVWRFQGRAPGANEQWRAMLGGMAKVSGCYCAWQRTGLTVALSASGFPKVHRFQITPLGEAGRTSQLWFGVQAGVVWDLSVTDATQ